jgi:hypothetical protein
MTRLHWLAWFCVMCLFVAGCFVPVIAQQSSVSVSSNVVVPPFVRFSSVLRDLKGNPQIGVVGVTFSLYKDSQGGVAVWTEVQNVHPDNTGHYSVMLGSEKSSGLPTDVFISGQGRWLGVQPEGQPEQARVLLLSVPYALKAADAETLGGKPATAFALAPSASGPATSGSGTKQSGQTDATAPLPSTIGGSGTAGSVALWTSPTSLGTANVVQEKNGAIQVHTSLTVKGAATINGAETANRGLTVNSGPTAPVTLTVNSSNAQGSSAVVINALEAFDANAAVVINASEVGLGISASSIGINAYADSDAAVIANSDDYGVVATGGGDGVFASLSRFTGAGAAGVYGEGAPPDSFQGLTFGIEGLSPTAFGIGASGSAVSTSQTGGSLVGASPFGVWGDTGVSGVNTAGVLATADDAIAVRGANNSLNPTAYFNNAQNSSNAVVLSVVGAKGSCQIYGNGNLTCTGTKSAVVPLSNGRSAALYAVESPENWFEDFGSGQLSNGSTIVRLDQSFAETVTLSNDYHVFLTPRGDCEGLYVASTTAAGFEVRELRGGHSNIQFDYRIVAHRKGYEAVRLADMTPHFNTPVPSVRSKPLRLAPPVLSPRIKSLMAKRTRMRSGK